MLKEKLLLLLFLPLFGWAQDQARSDSLHRLLKTTKQDTSRVNILVELAYTFMYSELGKVEQYMQEATALAEKLKDPRSIGSTLNLLAGYYDVKNIDDSSEFYYLKTLDYSKEHKLNRLHARVLAALGALKMQAGDHLAAERYFLRNQEWLKTMNDSLALGINNHNIAGLYLERGFLHLALDYYTQALNYFKNQPERFRIADVYTGMGDVNFTLEYYETALDHYSRAEKIYRELNDWQYLTFTCKGQGLVYARQKKFTEAQAMLDEASTILKDHPDEKLELNILSGRSELALEKEEFQKAVDITQQLINRYTELNNPQQLALNYNQQADALNKLNRPEAALRSVNQSIHYADSTNNIYIQVHDYSIRSDANSKLGNYREALEDYKKYHELYDTVHNRENTQKIEELRIQFDLEKKEGEISRLALEVEKNRLRKTLFAVGMVSAAVIALLVFISFRQRNRRIRAEFEITQATMKQEIELKQAELEFKKKELASQTLHIAQKNMFLQELKEKLEELQSNREEKAPDIRRIIQSVKREDASEKDWETFKKYFNEIHNDFDQKLRAVYNDITDKELRLASFVKMNLSTKEIAAILNVLPDSVLKSKYRIKKKLNIEQETDLYRYLQEL